MGKIRKNGIRQGNERLNSMHERRNREGKKKGM
jgi:hypothetical protein